MVSGEYEIGTMKYEAGSTPGVLVTSSTVTLRVVERRVGLAVRGASSERTAVVEGLVAAAGGVISAVTAIDADETLSSISAAVIPVMAEAREVLYASCSYAPNELTSPDSLTVNEMAATEMAPGAAGGRGACGGGGGGADEVGVRSRTTGTATATAITMATATKTTVIMIGLPDDALLALSVCAFLESAIYAQTTPTRGAALQGSETKSQSQLILFD